MAVKISTNPPIPSNTDKDFDPQKLKSWIAGNCNPEFHAALYEAIDNVRRVSFAEFLKKLEKCICPNMLKKASVLVSERKSNKWVAEIARSYFPSCFFSDTKFESLGSEDANDFVSNLDKVPLQNWPDKIMLFDDGSFTGRQMTRHVKAIVDKFEPNKTNVSIHVVIPFLTSTAKQLLNNIKHCKDIRLNIHSAETMDTVEECLSKKTLNP